MLSADTSVKNIGQAKMRRINILRYNIFMFRQQSSLLLGKAGPIYQVLVGLTIGRLAGKNLVV